MKICLGPRSAHQDMIGDILEKPIYVKTYISHIKSFNIFVSIGLPKVGNEIFLISNMQGFRYWLCYSILDCYRLVGIKHILQYH